MPEVERFVGEAAVQALIPDYDVRMPDTVDVFVGKHLDTVEVEVTPALLADYANRIGCRCEGVPATLLLQHAHRELGSWYLLQVVGNLHLKQEWAFFQPMVEGSVIRASRSIVERYRRKQREVIVCEVNITCAKTGSLISRARSHQSFVVHPDGPAVVLPKQPVVDTPALLQWEGAPITVDQDLCNRYVGVDARGEQIKSYHNDLEYSKMLGFDFVVVQGTLTVALLSHVMQARFGHGWLTGGRLNVDLKKPAKMDDTLTAGCTVTRCVPEGLQWRAECEVHVKNQHGEAVLKGTASAILDSPILPASHL